MKFSPKRILSFILALGMILAMVPELGIKADAATTISGVSVTGLEATYVHSTPTSTLGTDGTTSCTGGTNNITATASSAKSSFLTGGKVTQATVTITLKNTQFDNAELSFHYNLSGTGANLSSSITASTGADADYKVTLKKNESVTIKLTSNSGGTQKATLAITNIKLLEKIIVKTTFLPADPTTGSYTVGGTQITAQTEKEQEATSPYAVIATPATGYRFVGWYSETTGEYLSFDATTDLYVGSAMSVKPIFESDVDAVFGVGTRRFNDLKAAAGYAGVASTKQINLLKNATVPAGNYTIPTGVTLLIPFDSANTLYTAEPSNAGRITEESTGNKVPFWETPFCYRTLTLASGASIKVDGAISVSAKHTLGHGSKPYGGSVSGAYGQIAMQGTSSITVASGGALYAWGYITGSGSVTAQSGAKVYEYFQIADFRGGTVTSDMIDGRKTYKVFPFSQFYVQNIEVPLTLHAGSEELLYSGLHMADTEVPFEIKFIGTASNESLFRLSDGASMTKRYNPTTEQMTYELSGNITMSNLKLGFDKLSWAVQAIISGYLGSSAINSSEFVFPVTNNLSINVNSGTLTINQDVALLPGSSVTVASGATVNMYSGKSFIVYDRDEWMSDTFVHSTGPVYFQPAIYTPARGLTSSRTTDSLVDAKVEINGTLQMDGNAYTTAGGANITSTGGGIIVFKNAPDTTKTVAYEYSQVSTNGGFKSLTVTPAKLYNSASVTDKTVPTYTETANDTAAGDAYVWKNGKWEKVTAKISFVKSIDNFDPDGTEITGSIADATVSGYVIIDGTGYDYTLPDSTGFTAANYDFAGWSEKSDGSGIILAAGDKVKIKGDTTYYATWTPKEYTVSFNAGEGVTVAPIIGKYQTQITAPTPTKNGCTLSGWAKEGTDTVMYKPGDKITVTGDETLYAIWEVQKCTITWVNDDGSNLASVQVENGNAFPAYPKDTEPAKAGDAQYSYVFAGWSIDNDKTVDELPATVTGDVTLKAVYTPVVNKYTVTWKDWNGTEIGSETVEYGTYLARLQPANPSRPEDAAATYGFAGWDADGNGTADTLPETVTGDVTYTATYTAYKKSYTITWVVNGATTTRSVDHGEIPVYPDAEPSKAADAQYTYTFAGWDADGDEDVDVQPDGAFPAVSGAATYTAVFDKTVNQYTITWKDGDGSILKEEKLNYGATPKYVGATPTKTSDGQYSYEWDGGWSPVIASVTKDADYQATFEKTTRTYTVIWQNEDGTELEKDTGVEYGADPSYDGAEPAKEGNAQYTYTFAGWDPAVDKVKSDVTYKATYTPETNKYTVTWKDWDGTVLETDENVPYGTQPEFNKTKEPSRAANAQYTYHWTGGWTTEVETVKGDVVYTAAYTSVVNKYTITWLDDDGTPAFEPTEVAYGEMPSCPDPVKEEDAQYTYVFAGWTPALKPVDGDATYTATYTHTVKEYQIQFVNENGTVLNSKKVAYGTVPTYEGTTPVKAGDAQYTYEFAGWDKEIVAVTGEATYTATFNSILNQYTVIWENEDGTELEKDEGVDYGTTPSYDGAVPTKAATAEYTYTFDKWNPTVSEVTGNVTYTATYSQKANEYTVTYYSDPDKVYETIEVAFGEDFPTVEAPSKEGYTFTGWDKEIPETMPAENVTITAKWEIEKHTLTFQDVDGTVIATINQEFGTNVTKPVNPQKAGYTFVNWDKVVPATMPAEDRVYTAVWDIIPYDVSYELVGGSLEEGKTNPVSYNVETDTFTLNNPTKKGYDFAGWTGTGITGAAQTVTVEEGSIGDRSYTATWTPIEYTISYNLAEGNLDVGKTNPTSYTIETPTFTLKNPTREGYTFLGWVGSNGTTENPNVSVLKGTVGELSYTAKWEINTYTVTYVADGETVTTRTVAHGSDVEDVPAVPTKIGYDKTAPYWNHDGKNITSDTVIEAVYTINKYTVTYVANGETVATKTVEHGADVEEVPDVPAKVGYDKTAPYWNNDGKDIASDTTIEAVYTINEYTVTYVADGQIVDTKTVTHGADVGNVPAVPVKEGYTQNAPKWNHDGKNITSDLTIEAVYTINKYTVTYVANGETVSEQTVEHGSDAEVPGIPVKEGYTQTNPYWSHNGKNIKSDLTIEAVYTINKYTVTYVANGETVATKTVEHGADVEEVPDVPVKEGYTQNAPYWNHDGKNITSDTVIEAVYTINKYTVTYVANGETVATKTVEHGADVEEVPDVPAKEGYTQNAPEWNHNGKNIKSDLTIEAVYTINTYTVTYKADGEIVETMTVKHGYDVEEVPAVPVKEGYTQNAPKWNHDGKNITSDLTIEAVYTINKYTVTYVANGETVSEQTVEHGSDAEVPGIPVKEGYTQTNPYWSHNGKNIKSDLTIEAVYTINKYTVTYVIDGKTVKTESVEHGKDATAPAIPAKEGYTQAEPVWDKVSTNITADITITAVYTINKYTVTYVADGETVDTQTVEHGKDAVVPAIPTKEGYTQNAPYWNADGKKITSDTTIEAVYTINTYTVTYVTDSGNAIGAVTKTHNETADALADSKTGHTFLGWAEIAGGEVVYEAGDTITFTKSMTLYAKWSVNSYTITYYVDGAQYGSVATVEYNTQIELPAEPTKDGFKFYGWVYKDETSVGMPQRMPAQNLEVAASWIENQYVITFYPNMGDATGTKVQMVDIVANGDTTATLDSNTFQRTGYTFLGWAETADGQVKYENAVEVSLTGDLPLYAVWSVNKYTITFANTGDSTVASITANYGADVDAPADPVKEGYHFVGWSEPIPDTMPAKDMTITANWEINTYTVTYVADGKIVDTQSVEHGADAAAPQIPVKIGYDKTAPYWNNAGKNITADTTITAVYTINTYTVTYKADGKIVDTQSVEHGADAVAPQIPVKTGYTDTAPYWNENGVNITADTVIEAVYTVNKYTVKYVIDGAVVSTQTVEHGANANAPEIPGKTGYDQVTPKWDKVSTNITADMTITAIYTINKYTVKYVVDGEVKDTQTVEHGKAASAPEIPAKTGYDQVAPKWDKISTNITADTTITAVYTVNKYTVKYVIDGETVDTQTVEHGANASAPEIPAKTGYDQVAPKWDKVSTNITADTTITAVYTINTYKVTYMAGDLKVASQNVEHGADAVAPQIPAKDGYTQTAPYWDADGKNITSDTTITAVYTINKYTVKYVVDGEVKDTQTVEHGKAAAAPEIPAKTGYDQVAPEWNHDGKNITSDLTIEAVYTINKYTVKYVVDGEVKDTQTVEHGKAAAAPEIPAKTGYDQVAPKWDKPSTNITSDITIEAVYTINKYTVKYVVDGEVKDTQTVEHGKAAAAPEIPAKTGYDQVAPEWNHDGKNITSDLTIEAVYTINKYTVKYVVDGEVKDTQTVEHGKAAAAPEIPAKTGYDQVVPEWDKPSTNITADTTITAVYTINKYTVTFHTDSGNTIDAITKTYNETVSAPADSKTGHTFQGWAPVENGTVLYKAGESITFNQDRQLYAIWSVNKYTVNFELENETFESREVAYGEAITAPASEPTKEGHTFGGWYNGNQKVTFPITMPEDGLALTAKWTVNKYFIYFMDGDSTVDSKRLDYGAAIEAPAAPTKEGYTFTGWDPAVPATMPAKDLTVNAQWDANAYTITFNTDGGTAVESATYDFGETVTAPAAPTKEGYTFTGWSPALPKTMPAKDYEVTAQWKINQYTITFDSDGGSAVAAIKQDYNTAVTAPAAPTKTGYTFDGWDAEIPATMPAENLTIKAKWTINEYSITFDANDDGEAETTITKNYGEQVDAPTAPEKEGYTFDGWYSGETKVNFPITMPADGMTLKAHWNVNRYTITFNSNGGTRVNAITDDYGATITAPAAPTKTGYTFTGWLPALPATMPVDGLNVTAQWQINQYTITFDTDGGSDVAAITQDYDTDVTRPANPTKIGYTFGGWVDENGAAVNVPSTMPARNVTLKAKWNINTYTITFNTDGGSAVAPITQQYGTAVTAPAAPTKVGYTFAGWDVEVPTTMPAGNLVITAKWTVNQYTITFDTDGGSEVDAIIQNYGTDVTAPAAPTKTGYTFDGWDAEIPTTMPAGDMTIKAKWKINQYTIVFYTAGGSAVKSITAEFGAPITAPADPTKEGHTFTGWNQEIPATMPATNMNIVASWSINSYTITFADCDVAPITAEFGAEVVAPANPTRIGYTFLGWDKTVPATMPAGDMTITAQWRVDQHTITFADCGLNPINASYGTVIDKPADPARTGYTFLGWDVAIPETMPAKDMTITALWQINQYTITFDTDGGTAIDPITQDYNTAVTEPADPEKIGYTFVGWDKDIPLTMPAEDQTITAKWTINQYTVTFDTDGGSAVESVAKNYGEQIEEPAAPEKEGHSFTGWVDVEGNAVSFPVTVGAQDVTIKAIWKANQYTITFNTDGGNEIASITQDYGTVITAPANPTKEGYSFAGWNVKIPETMPAGDMTITAKWNINRYTITFNTDGGSEITAISRPYGTEIIAPEDPVKEGHTFLGWDQEIPATMPAGDMTITAQWQINQYTISFKGCEHESITADYGTPLNIEDPTREGYSFDGWNDVVPATMPAQDMELTARWVINQYTITFNTAGGDELDPITQDYGTPINFNTSPEREGYTFITWSPELPKTMPAQDMTLTAIWTLDTYTITFDTAGGSAMAPIVQQYGTEIVAPENPTREGYIFDGWDIKIPETMPAENLTITASWKPATFTITFVSDGEEVGSVTAEYGSAIRPVNPPSKTGYDFAGWEPAIPATMPSEDLVVTAKWTPQKYTLYFDANGGEEIPLMTMDYGAKIEVPADPVREGYIFTGWDMEIPETMPAEDLVIVASWKIGSFAITFDTDGGSEVGEIVQNYGTPVRVPEDPTRTGYTFVGWEPEIPETMPGKDMTIKAIWKAKQYTLSFNTEGGSEIEPITADYGSPITAPKAPKKAGYTFVGWDKKIPETMPARNMIFNAIWEEGEEPADLFYISFANMTLGNSLKMNFAFEQGHLEDWTGHYATIRKTYADGRPDVVATIPYEQWGQAGINGKAYYTISFNGIAAKEMADDVFVTVFNADGEAVSYVWEDSVRAYAMRTMNNPNSSEETLIMVVDMLNYGAAAQNYFEYDTEDPANNQLTEEQLALATPSVTFSDSRISDENYLGTLLRLESQILMRLAFNNVTEDMYAVISFTSHSGKSYEVTVQSDEFEFTGAVAAINVDEIVVADGRKPVTVTVYNADGTVHSTVTESMESYIARMSESDVLYELIMKFSDSAYNYFHKDDV